MPGSSPSTASATTYASVGWRAPPDGSPDAPGQAVEVRDADGFRVGIGVMPIEVLLGHGKLRTDADGVVTIPRVAPGTYTVRVGGHDYGKVVVGDAPVSRTLRK